VLSVIFGFDPALTAVAILVVTYVLVISDRFDRSIIALLGAGAMILSGVLTQAEALQGIDFNTIALLIGMMILVSVASRSGLFEYVAIRSAQLVRGSPAGVLLLLSLVTAVISAFLNNVTLVLVIAPVTLSIAQRLRIAPFPFLLCEVMASNIGGAATLIGDPPNIMIGSAAGLSFNAFLLNLTPVVAAVMAAQLIASHLIWGRSIAATREARDAVMSIAAGSAITDRRLLCLSLIVCALTLLGFVFAAPLRLEPGSIALIGAAVLMLLDNLVHHRAAHAEKMTAVYGDVDWITIFFFVGLFVVVHGVEKTGVLTTLAHDLIVATHGNVAVTASAILWIAAIVSAIIDNIPLVAAMIPVIKALAPELGGPTALAPLWWALALGASLGGNGTLVGASANLAVAGIARRAGVRFDFESYTRLAAPLTLLGLAICQLYLWLRYF
jgi:Na+/H+ antiporter NhaD/arsenite permease-like protein